jgi:hypothetical protein
MSYLLSRTKLANLPSTYKILLLFIPIPGVGPKFCGVPAAGAAALKEPYFLEITKKKIFSMKFIIDQKRDSA